MLRSFVLLAPLAAALLITAACSAPAGQAASDPSEIKCPSAPVASGAPDPAPDDPDFSLYGFPRVAATQHFTPGQSVTVSSGPVTVTLPADMYTQPLEFELLLGSVSDWQPCLGNDRIVIAPYAYRATDPSTHQLVGRFDNPPVSAITDPRISNAAVYWLTYAEVPPHVEPSPNQPSIEGATLKEPNPFARRGWFVTVPRT
jgi:hypothetical protein